MNTMLIVAKEEWRYWRRSELAFWAAILFLVLLVTTTATTAVRIAAEQEERSHHQNEAEATFAEQPDRHPHRMVHYGHYVFRTPSPLAVFDPGVEPVTGQSMFLEGHRQNTAMFADTGASAELGGLSGLTPAVVYQLFGPLLIILLGHGSIVREREASTLAPMLAQGISGTTLLGGKFLALLLAIGLMLVPLLLSTGVAMLQGASLSAALLLALIYLIYLATWALLAVAASALLARRSMVLATLTALWLTFTLLMPSLAVSNAARSLPIAGKIETDLVMLADLRKLGDGHNAEDPAFAKLRAELLAQYDVDTVEELPINFRGVVAGYSEEKLTRTLNEYAEQRMAQEVKQTDVLKRHAWITPTLAIASASRSIAATDLANHQRFLREAEAVRIDFVQGLNRVHAEELSYYDDVNRSDSEEASRRGRVSSDNWQVLQSFRFEPENVGDRIDLATPSMLALLAWLLLLGSASLWAGARLKP